MYMSSRARSCGKGELFLPVRCVTAGTDVYGCEVRIHLLTPLGRGIDNNYSQPYGFLLDHDAIPVVGALAKAHNDNVVRQRARRFVQPILYVVDVICFTHPAF